MKKAPLAQQLTIDQAVSSAKKAAKQGDFVKAIELYNLVLQSQPNHFVAKKALRKLQKKRPRQASKSGACTSPSADQMKELVSLYHSKQLSKAEFFCCELLRHYPGSIKVTTILGAVLQGQGKIQEALLAFDQVIQLQPGNAQAYNNHALALHQLGRFAEAAISCDNAIALRVDFADAYFNRGNALQGLGRLDEAVKNYSQACKVKPDYAEAYANCGYAFSQLGQQQQALINFDKAISLKPDYAKAYCNRGNALQKLNRITEAVASYNQAVAFKSDYAEAYSNRGSALGALGLLDEALISFNLSIQFKSDNAKAYCNRSIVLKDLGRFQQAIDSCDKAVDLEPTYAEAYGNRGNALKELGLLAESLTNYDRAVDLKPDFVEAYASRATALRELGQLHKAVASYEQAALYALEYSVPARLVLPIILASNAYIDYWRKNYQDGIARLQDSAITLDSVSCINTNSFFLAYHNFDDRPIMEALCRLMRAKAPVLTYSAAHLKTWPARVDKRRRIRVGFVSQFLVDHTIGKLYQGFLHHLDRSRFEVVLVHAHDTRHDAFRQNLSTVVDAVINLPDRLEDQQTAVAQEELDVLFYPDIGMSSATYFLAYARLAPVQVVSWGHPDTTGLDTQDYFLSADSIEPVQAQANYRERLIRLNQLPCFYPAPPAPKHTPQRSEYGLPNTGVLYGCPQSLFKIHPDFDHVLAQIVTDDPDGHIVFIEGSIGVWTQQLKQRWAQSYPVLLDRAVFLPRQPQDRFIALMAVFEVLLDPIHFGSGNTLYEAMVYGTPIVTWPGQFMRGRAVAGAYRQMKIKDAPIVQHIEDYAPLAVALGQDQLRRQTLMQASVQGAKLLYSDMLAVREFESFLSAAVKAAKHGGRLTQNWRPPNFSGEQLCPEQS